MTNKMLNIPESVADFIQDERQKALALDTT
jgi:intergrase/recombinase